MTDFQAEGGCFCGAVRLRITAAPACVYCCHCPICRKQSGGPHLTVAVVPGDGFVFTRGEAAAFEAAPGHERLFCRACGAPLAMRETAGNGHSPGHADVLVSALDDPGLLKPQFHFYNHASRRDLIA
jgi:hypothetical protein